jgi:hypothetical protein
MLRKIYDRFGDSPQQRELNFSHHLAAAALVLGALVHQLCV